MFFNIRLKQLVSVIHFNITSVEEGSMQPVHGLSLENRLSSTLDFYFFGILSMRWSPGLFDLVMVPESYVFTISKSSNALG